MSKTELELPYRRALQEWMFEEHVLQRMVAESNASGYADQTLKEEAARQRYRKAQLAFLNAPNE